MAFTRMIAGACVAVATVGTLAVPALAADSIWDHNGSEMLWQADGASRVISYQSPRPGLPVAPGTVLFEGQRVDHDGQPNTPDILEGTARIFREGCPPAEYWVSGAVIDETHVVLYGAAPIRAASGCAVTGYSQTSSNATLEFTYLRSAGNTVPSENTGGGVVQPADEDLGQDAIGHQEYIIPLPGHGEILIRVDTGVGSHAEPDLITASMICSSGERHTVIAEQPPFYACQMQDASADMVGSALIIDALRYDHNTSACAPLRYEYSFAGLCD